MNNRACGCGKNMPCKTMPRMPRTMAMKPASNSCQCNNWANANDYDDNKCENSCNKCCAKEREGYCSMNSSKNSDCTCNVLGMANQCGKACDMPREKKCGFDMDWAKKYERSCGRCGDDSYAESKRYRKCNKGCELTFGEEVDELPIAMGYVPYQEWDCNVSNACQGLYDGTIFPELVKPFVCTYCYGERSCR